MTRDRDKFNSLVVKDGVKVSFGGNQSGKITGVGEVGPVQDVYLVEGLCHNLLSVSQSTDKGNWIITKRGWCSGYLTSPLNQRSRVRALGMQPAPWPALYP